MKLTNPESQEITVEANQKSKILITFDKQTDFNLKVTAQPDSTVEIVTIYKDNNYNHTRESIAKRNSTVIWTDLFINASGESKITSKLEEKGAETEQNIYYITDKELNIASEAIHNAEHTKSNLLTRGVLTNDAKTKTTGLININSKASKSKGYQKQDALLLSTTAKATAIPNLEIQNHDVKCSHGSTISQIDKDLLFYLMSRGLTKKQAEGTIVQGYFSQVLDQLDTDTKTYLQAQIHEAIE